MLMDTYKGEPDIHLEVLEAVKKFTDIPLVLHGCTGMKEEIIKDAIKLGVAKINFGTEIRYKYVEHYEEGLKTLNHQGTPGNYLSLPMKNCRRM